jgi:HPt (histidine-containing phosphotransfer) domain-containing protein
VASDFDDRMTVLRERFAVRCARRRGDLSVAIASDDRSAMVRIAHELAGNAGIFGFATLSRLAQDFEEAARAGRRPGAELHAQGETLLQALAEVADEPGQ